MFTVEASATTTASPEEAWAEWIAVDRWSQGGAVEEAELDGAFEVGSTIKTKSKGFPRTTMAITVVDPPRLWVDEARTPFVRMTFEHVVEPDGAGSRLTERAIIRGPFSPIVGVLMRGKLERLLTTATKDLASRVSN